MANFVIFVFGTALWGWWSYRNEWRIAWDYLKMKFLPKRLKYIRKDVI